MSAAPVSRRVFAATALSYSRVFGANDRVRVGYVGLGNRGDQVHDAFLEHGDAQTVAICDLKQEYLDLAASKSRGTPKRYADYRALLDDKEVDAVAIATPDHWHALMFTDACLAGKDVYVEKPLSLTVAEGRHMVNTAAKAKRVTQVGIHRRSAKFLREAVEFVRAGGLGKVTVAKSYHIIQRVAAWNRESAIGESAEPRRVGPVAGSGRWFPTTRTAPTTISAGFSRTRAGSSPTWASTTWI
ncbi:MAG: Gfo/Idh/MocA family oxidoreductase [Bryobacteraceae bacterium]